MNDSDRNFWLVIGINAHTLNQEVIVKSLHRDTAICHKIDLEAERPRRYCGVTIEYGKLSEQKLVIL